MKYLHENPVWAGLVRFEGDYVYSSGLITTVMEKDSLKLTISDRVRDSQSLTVRRALRNSMDRGGLLKLN